MGSSGCDGSSTTLRADRNCKSCGGTGWAVIRAGNITYGMGACRCVGGHTWAVPRV